jgi:hypothetical protein
MLSGTSVRRCMRHPTEPRDCWERASKEERSCFANNVGLRRLLQFALRDALLRQLTDASRTWLLRHWSQHLQGRHMSTKPSRPVSPRSLTPCWIERTVTADFNDGSPWPPQGERWVLALRRPDCTSVWRRLVSQRISVAQAVRVHHGR